MNVFRSLQSRLALAVGIPVTVLWLAAAGVTVHRLDGEMEEVFDDGLKATAERILRIAAHDLREGHRHGDVTNADGESDDDDEKIAFVVRSRSGEVLLQSGDADPASFPPFEERGFRQTKKARLYYDSLFDGRMTIAVAEPLDHRRAMSRKMLAGLVLPLIVVIPLSLLAIAFAVRHSLRPVRDLQQGLSDRGVQDLSPLPDTSLPSELAPISAGVNQLLDRLRGAFEAERTLAANAAHELRTPVAGAIAQAQRIRKETHETQTQGRAIEIETTLKRLMRMSEKLMQMARAEGSRLTLDDASDLRPVVNIVVKDFVRTGEDRIALSLPERPVLSNLDPDAVGILCRNLIENALRHGRADSPVTVSLADDGALSVTNDGPVLEPEALAKLMNRFERGTGQIGGTGLGLSIVRTIAERGGAELAVLSPLPDSETGVRVTVMLPLVTA